MNASQSNQHLPLFREAVLLLAFPLLTRLSVMMVMLFRLSPSEASPFRSFLTLSLVPDSRTTPLTSNPPEHEHEHERLMQGRQTGTMALTTTAQKSLFLSCMDSDSH